jgi:murein DD-endopeptidase MepM/ murein hydrolase activator NlpD
LRIPHWIVSAIVFTVVGIIVGFLFISLRASYYRLHAESLNAEFSRSIERTEELLEEKQEIESNVERQKEIFEEQIGSFESQLEYYHRRASELEERIEELNEAREEIYDMLSESTGRPITRHVPNASMGGPHVAFVSRYDAPDELDAVLDGLESRLSEQFIAYDSLMIEAKEIMLYLESRPSIWPVYGTVTSEFGTRPDPFGFGLESHTGIDIAVPTGTDVLATAYGTVSFSGWEGGYGYLVIIDHGHGYETFFGHNSNLIVEVGDRVSRGDVIAESGNTGRSTGPHVHYEVRRDGELLNPRDFMR